MASIAESSSSLATPLPAATSVAGAEVQIDGVRNLVITVPGNEDLSGLTRSAQMNIRPVLTDASGNPAISYPAGYTPAAAATDTAAATTAAATGSATGSAAASAPLKGG